MVEMPTQVDSQGVPLPPPGWLRLDFLRIGGNRERSVLVVCDHCTHASISDLRAHVPEVDSGTLGETCRVDCNVCPAHGEAALHPTHTTPLHNWAQVDGWAFLRPDGTSASCTAPFRWCPTCQTGKPVRELQDLLNRADQKVNKGRDYTFATEYAR